MTKIQVTVYRSQKWLNAVRLETGEDVPESINIEVSPADLSIEARKIILGSNGYQNVRVMYYTRKYEINFGGGEGGREHVMVDADMPQPQQISDAIVAAAARIETKRLKAEAEKRQCEEAAARELAEKTALENRKDEARKLLADELDALRRELDAANERIAELEAIDDDADDDSDDD